MKLHLGCGKDYWDGFENVDINPVNKTEVCIDLHEYHRYPWEDNSVDKFVALHLLEHLQNTLGVMQRLHRCAKPGALFYMAVPYGSSDDAWEDPTHIRPFFYNTPFYYSQEAYHRADYNYFGDWQLLRRYMIMAPHVPKDQAQAQGYMLTQRNCVREMWCVLEAIKPIRQVPFKADLPKTKYVFDNSTRSILLSEAKA